MWGWRGWSELAPFDAIIVSCALEEVPQKLLHQLKSQGRLVAPIQPQGEEREEGSQELRLWKALPYSEETPLEERHFVVESLGTCHFVKAT